MFLQSLSCASYSFRSPLCSVPASLLPSIMLKALAWGLGLSAREDWQPLTLLNAWWSCWLLLRASDCWLLKPEVVLSQCPAQKAVSWVALLGQNPHQTSAGWQCLRQRGEPRNYPPQKNMNPSWIWTSVSYVTPFRKHGIVCFQNQFPAIQENKKPSVSEVKLGLLNVDNNPSSWSLGSWGIPTLPIFKDHADWCPGRIYELWSSWENWSSPTKGEK